MSSFLSCDKCNWYTTVHLSTLQKPKKPVMNLNMLVCLSGIWQEVSGYEKQTKET